ncbi:hypothetical protein K431DRAFT_297751 [Polychaeton citri CBS 116435]|uniref:Uncharacterized protein n=1 Tax=Polychaeton citri CBS 116435 TaxID=1314669 RepID=A0A9P4PYX7_9PEZI|nr:hypothetical protein K431DRAFT_297751 [Polychaeton citri CBS 116435]
MVSTLISLLAMSFLATALPVPEAIPQDGGVAGVVNGTLSSVNGVLGTAFGATDGSSGTGTNGSGNGAGSGNGNGDSSLGGAGTDNGNGNTGNTGLNDAGSKDDSLSISPTINPTVNLA